MDRREANRRSWNHATRAHNAHKADQAGFLRRGGSTLFPEERALLGDVAGRRLVHLQCNSGQDTLSLAALGADVVGVDISDEAIDFATRLSAESGIPARFVRSDVYDWLREAPPSSADVVFVSYGALPWLDDLETWARGVARLLVPGGRLVVVEFHPMAMALDDDYRLGFPSGGGQPIYGADGIGDYVALSEGALSPSGHVGAGDAFENPEPCWEFGWGLGDVIGACLGAGLRLDRFEEHPWANGCNLLRTLVPAPGERFVPPPGVPTFPLMYGLLATRV